MLELRPNCECCNTDLPPSSKDAFICSFECTFCQRCAAQMLDYICPNCSGNLVQRPIRPTEKLEKYPASTQRVVNEKLLRMQAATRLADLGGVAPEMRDIPRR